MNPFLRLRLSTNRLERMLENDPDGFERILRRHPSVGDRFERGDLFPADARASLREAFAPPDDLTERLNARLNAALDSPTARSAALDLLGLGLATVRELTRDDPA